MATDKGHIASTCCCNVVFSRVCVSLESYQWDGGVCDGCIDSGDCILPRLQESLHLEFGSAMLVSREDRLHCI